MGEPAALSYEVLVADGVPGSIDLQLPNGERIVPSPSPYRRSRPRSWSS
jgi:hypothetical protein